MKDTPNMTVLGILMQRDAELHMPDDAHATATWQAISQAISQPAPVAKARSAEDRKSSLFEGLWNPRTAFGSEGTPRSSWRYPSRRLVAQAFSLVLIVVLFLAAGLVFNRGGFMPDNRPTVTIPDDTIPLVNPGLPTAAELQAFLSSADSTVLAGLPKLSPEQQRAGLEAVCGRNGIALTRLPAAGNQFSTYWTGRREAAGKSQALILLAREQPGSTGWTVMYQLVPASQAVPKGADLDTYFNAILAAAQAG